MVYYYIARYIYNYEGCAEKKCISTYLLSTRIQKILQKLQDLFEFPWCPLVLNLKKISCNCPFRNIFPIKVFPKSDSNNNRWVQYMIFQHIWLTHNRGIIQRRAERRVLVCIILCRCCRGIFSYICSHPL